eukprot:m.190033 g.190033  ORF g.190033 m.190033 type:complete len:525 (+) comp14807_c0_seq1:153-1727(+)
MPAVVVVRALRARGLPVMDSMTQSADPYVHVRLAQHSFRTRIQRKTLEPVWDESASFDVDDEALQDAVLVATLWDHDFVGNDDEIGQVAVDLKPMLREEGSQQISGWFPVYDTLKGVRGSIALEIKMKVFWNHHIYRTTSAGVPFLTAMAIPECYELVAVLGLVEELVVNDDPEYQWIDRLRPTRASNQARQNIFANLTGELQRKIGVKALELGANAVVGYRQLFDLEGASGLVARGMGTAVKLTQHTDELFVPTIHIDRPLPSAPVSGRLSPQMAASTGPETPSTPLPLPTIGYHAISGPQGYTAVAPKHGLPELPLTTLREFPPNVVLRLGGIVAARAVKLLDKMEHPDETTARDAWWSELRNEVTGHARALGYSAVIGYTEATTIEGNLCLLSATGTAAILNTDPKLAAALISGMEPFRLRSTRRSSVDALNTVDSDVDEEEEVLYLVILLISQCVCLNDFTWKANIPLLCHTYHSSYRSLMIGLHRMTRCPHSAVCFTFQNHHQQDKSNALSAPFMVYKK